MIRRLTSLMAVVIFAGSAFLSSGWFDTNADRLIGEWHMAIEMTDADLRQMSPTENPLAATFAQMFMKTVQAEVTVVFRTDHSVNLNLSFLGNSYERSAAWRLVENDGQTAQVDLKFSKESESVRWVLKFQDKDTFQSTPPIDSKWAANKMVTFRRVKPAST